MAVGQLTNQLGTEQHDRRFWRLDEMSVAEIVATMNEQDQAVPEAIRRSIPQISAAITAAEAAFGSGGRLIYLGAGTSGRLGVLDAAECPPTFHTDPERVIGLIAGGPRSLVEAVEGAEDDSAAGAADLAELQPGPSDIVVGLSASGRTPYVTGGLAKARSMGALTIAVSCNPASEISQIAEFGIEVLVGPEVLAGSTRLKAGTAQKLVLNMLSTALMARTGRTYGNLMVDMSATNAKLHERAVAMVSMIADVTTNIAAEALNSADHEVKTATVMLVRGIDAERARQLLAEAGGRLGVASGIPSSRHPVLASPPPD